MNKTAINTLIGSSQLCLDLVNLGVDVASEMHLNIGSMTGKSLNLLPGIRDIGNPIFKTQEATAQTIYQSVAWGPKKVSAALSHLELSAEALVSSQPELDTIAAINGAIGSHLAKTNNPLAIEMTLVHNGHPVSPDNLYLSGKKVCVFVHGLCSSENIWQHFSQTTWQKENQSYETFLRRDHDYEVVYLRYNTGKHISQNGQALSQLLNQLQLDDVQEFNLIGHSMGGLLIRSASHYACAHKHDWQTHLTKTICIGSPHGGAPLERSAHLGIKALGLFSASAPLSKIANFRSEGIKDLRYGYIQDEEWEGYCQDTDMGDRSSAFDHITQAKHGVIGASMSQDLKDWASAIIGDGLVPIESALGNDEKVAHVFDEGLKEALPGINHLHLTNHPAVYAALARFLTQ